jgi:hypothetical protein
MYQELRQVGFPELMTEAELLHFLRIPAASHGAKLRQNLPEIHGLRVIKWSGQRL